MTATNIFYNFVGFRYSPALTKIPSHLKAIISIPSLHMYLASYLADMSNWKERELKTILSMVISISCEACPVGCLLWENWCEVVKH